MFSLFLSNFGMQSSFAASSVPPIEVVFMCTTTKNSKSISLYKQGDNFIYQFGLLGSKPEISIVAKDSEVIKEPWNGIGSLIWTNITLQNGEYSYTVRSAYTRNPEITTDSFGVDIAKNDTFIASVQCAGDPQVERLAEFAPMP